jgi:hypothetical protein
MGEHEKKILDELKELGERRNWMDNVAAYDTNRSEEEKADMFVRLVFQAQVINDKYRIPRREK